MKYSCILISVLSLVSCDPKVKSLELLSVSQRNAESVYFTRDYENNPVLVWTEKDDNETLLLYAVSRDAELSFAAPVKVLLDPAVATHAEGMPKIAFKKDGTVVMAYEKKAPTEVNKFAGFVCYRVSHDAGKSWSSEKIIHSDTTSGRSRSFFDIETLADGEVGASWLDVKIDTTTGGRSVRFAKTNSENIFSNEILVDSSACQCCRTEVFSDVSGSVNVAYRGLKKGIMGASIRDMKISTSLNNGQTFTTPIQISEDNWNIDGCPHTGPALCSNNGRLQALWYTEGNGTGIFFAHRNEGDENFTSKELVSASGRHPQASSNENSAALVWEENITVDEKTITRIRSRIKKEDRSRDAFLSPENNNAFLPVITKNKTGFLVAFLMEQNDKTGVYVKKLN